MKLTRKKIIIISLLVVVLGLLFFLSRPSTVVWIVQSIDEKKAGLEEKTIQVDNNLISYLEGGSGETVLLVHGFGGDKYNWVYFAKYLKGKYHVIAIDLPGFGESSKSMDESYDIDSQTERVKRFMDLKGINKFNIAGNSMGGSISGAYAVKYPDQILSLCLIDAGGVKSPEDSDFIKELKKGKNPLVLKNVEDYDIRSKYVFVNPPELPDLFKKYLTEESIKSSEMNRKIFKDVIKLDTLQKSLNKIKAKTLIIWGDTDRILHVSGAHVFHKAIAGSKLVIIKDCGHTPMIEKPQETAEILLDFLK